MLKTTVTRFLAGAGLALGLTGCGLGGGPSLPEIASGPSSATAASLPGGTWRLVSLAEAGQPGVAIARPELFTADFSVKGHVDLRADCNRCMGACTSGVDTLSVGPMACTRAYCASAPLDDTFTRLVSGARTWRMDGPQLVLASEAGTLRFAR